MAASHGLEYETPSMAEVATVPSRSTVKRYARPADTRRGAPFDGASSPAVPQKRHSLSDPVENVVVSSALKAQRTIAWIRGRSGVGFPRASSIGV